MLGLNDDLYFKFSKLIRDKLGIEYGPNQRNILNNRLMSLLMANKLDDFSEYYKLLIEDSSGEIMSQFVSKVTTNHTYFYREKSHFEFLESDVFPDHKKRILGGQKSDLRYWVAASSSGEEAYTLALLLNKHFHKPKLSEAAVLATDISRNVIEKAIAGVYKKSEVEKLPMDLLDENFIKLESGTHFEISNEIKKMVTFKILNLIRDKFPFQGKFDVIFIRNVLIYFDSETRERLISQLYELLNPGGHLFIGQTETVAINVNKFKLVFDSVYRRDL